MEAHGTPSPGQVCTVASNIIRALPRAFELASEAGIDTKAVIKWTGQVDRAGERLSLALAECFKMLYNGHVATILPRAWREENGIIYFSVTSDGMTGEGWINRLKRKGFPVGKHAKQVLRSPSFKPTSGVTTEVAVLKGTLFKDDDRAVPMIRAEGALRKLSKSNAEVACLIREKFGNFDIELMGLEHIITMHEPINDSDGVPSLLCVYGANWGGLSAACDLPHFTGSHVGGFAFAASTKSA